MSVESENSIKVIRTQLWAAAKGPVGKKMSEKKGAWDFLTGDGCSNMGTGSQISLSSHLSPMSVGTHPSHKPGA